ncbi:MULTISPECIES: DUF4258 domain-containing protein [unclassified Methanoculleus]|uniref:DUF4258 domain-containing protein n=1 Tax=unclassified Methanoculleus TaxID=2619537 RepID=UPI0025F0626C|nr:DUF4258 domain-containing protein [Methanoculleus sp. UBA377]
MNRSKDEIIELVDRDSVIISHHARVRMFERNISTDDLLAAIRVGEIVEAYSDDEPCPSLLMLGFIRDHAYHVVLGICDDHLRVITAYVPDDEHWIDMRTRRKKE